MIFFANDFKLTQGFTLIEIMVVLVLVALATALIPLGLNQLYARSSQDSVLQTIVADVRKCALRVQQEQRVLRLDSRDCYLTKHEKYHLVFEFGVQPEFYPDGSSNGRGIIIDRVTSRSDADRNDNGAVQDHKMIVRINRITSSVSVEPYAENK